MDRLGITMGDPAGIGPEICIKVLTNNLELKNSSIIYGSKSILERYRNILKVDEKFNYIEDSDQAVDGKINVRNIDIDEEINFGEVNKVAGEFGFRYIENAINDALKNKITAVVTCPINKEALNLAGHRYDGHTEIFSKLTNTKIYSMMLWSEKLIVNHVSTHCSIKEATNRVTKTRVLDCINLLNDSIANLKNKTPKIAVAGLNPHASENGLFGNEEKNEIIPAVKEAKNNGIDVEGPIAPDTVFVKAVSGKYDGVVCMYHDQGHIPIKLLAFDEGVNVTLGLPIIRTSVDHGTAFDIAGKGVAREGSLIKAINLALKLYKEEL